MKIHLKNKILEINLTFCKEPKIKKLEKELSSFFNKIKIEGRKINKFELETDKNNYEIIPLNPRIYENLCGGKYEKQLEEIGKKYGIKNLSFSPQCYGK